MTDSTKEDDVVMPDEQQSGDLKIIFRTMVPHFQRVLDPERKDPDASLDKVFVWLCVYSHLRYHEKTKRGRRLITAMQQTQAALDFVNNPRPEGRGF